MAWSRRLVHGKKRSGGGALIDIGIHVLDAVWYLMGTPRPLSLSALGFRNFAHLVRTTIFDVEDAVIPSSDLRMVPWPN